MRVAVTSSSADSSPRERSSWLFPSVSTAIPRARATTLSAIAIAEARQGNRDAALATLARARRLDPQCELLLRAESELTGPAATG